MINPAMQSSSHRGAEPTATMAMPLSFRAPPDGRSHFSASLSLGLLSHPSYNPNDNSHAAGAEPAASAVPDSSFLPVARVRLLDILGYEGAPKDAYLRAVETLSGSLTRYNAAVIELGPEDSTILRCSLESTRMFFKATSYGGGADSGPESLRKSGRGVYMYRAGRALEDGDLSPPCMREAFKCMGGAARAALCAIARNLRLRSHVFNDLLDDFPLPSNEVSSSVLVATFNQNSSSEGKDAMGRPKAGNNEFEKGLLALIASDSPGMQVCDSNGHWYVADIASGPGDLLLITGRTLSHVTAGLRPAASYRTFINSRSSINPRGRTSLTFRLMPRSNAILDCSPLSAAGHVIPQNFVPMTASQFMDDLSAEDNRFGNRHENFVAQQDFGGEPSLRSLLSDSISGAFLEDAVAVSCGHSFGGEMLRKVLEMARCPLCNSEIKTSVLIPNFALRAAAAALKNKDGQVLPQGSTFRKRRREKLAENTGSPDRFNKENRELTVERDSVRQMKGVGFLFAVNDRVVIKGNRRTPDRLVGKDGVITSQCQNGWYLVKILETGECVRLQFSSLCKSSGSTDCIKTASIPLVQNVTLPDSHNQDIPLAGALI
ncbi:RING/U-box superfamily protein isoform X2 [Wolffia australiana]